MSAITLLLSVLVFVAVPSRMEASNTQSPEMVAIPMELLANRPVIRVTVNGQGPFPFLIGPEDQTTQIDRELAELLKLKERKSAGVPEPAIELAFGNGKPAGKPITVPVTIAEIARFMPEVAQTVRPRGVISLSTWKDRLVTLDYAHWQVTLQPGTLPEPNGKDVFPLTADRQLRLPLSAAEHSVECRVDPLFPGGLLLPSSYASALTLDGTLREWGSFHTREGAVRVKEAKLATNLLLGPFEVRAPLVMVADSGEIAMVGTRWLGRFSITYDLANARVRLERLQSSGR